MADKELDRSPRRTVQVFRAVVDSLVQRAIRPRFRTLRPGLWLIIPLLLLPSGCAKFNTYYNAKRSFDSAEHIRDEAIKKHEDLRTPSGGQRTGYEQAIKKAQKVLDEYPGHSLTDDVLFLQAKAHHRLESYRQSIRKFNLLFQNFPATPYMEEALYLQGLNFLFIGALDSSQDVLDRLGRAYPESKYQAETRKVSGDNAFAMKDWSAAAESYREYLDLKDKVEERDRVGLKLAECYWELDDFYPAAEVLQQVSQDTESAELGFRARLLRARVHVRMQDFEIVDLLLQNLSEEAAIYKSDGDVVLVEAESLVAQGRTDEVAALLQNIPGTWATPSVKARVAEILGGIFLDQGDWEEALDNYKIALLQKTVLTDENLVRIVSDNLQDFLAAADALPDAKGERVASLKLLQANALLFGFERPHMAATLYNEAAADTGAADMVAVRALYGAYLTYDEYLDNPDSTAVLKESLLARFPESPQAFDARGKSDTNLFGYLLAIKSEEQADALANLSLEEQAALQVLGDVDVTLVRTDHDAMSGVRRRLVYLSRRDNLIFDPPERAVQLISDRQKAQIQQEALDVVRQAEFDSLLADENLTTGSTGNTPPVVEVDESGQAIAKDPTLPVTNGALDQAEKLAEEAAIKDKEEAKKKEKEEEEEKKKKKRDENWDYLR